MVNSNSLRDLRLNAPYMSQRLGAGHHWPTALKIPIRATPREHRDPVFSDDIICAAFLGDAVLCVAEIFFQRGRRGGPECVGWRVQMIAS